MDGTRVAHNYQGNAKTELSPEVKKVPILCLVSPLLVRNQNQPSSMNNHK